MIPTMENTIRLRPGSCSGTKPITSGYPTPSTLNRMNIDSRLLKQSYLDPKSNYEFIINRFPMLKKWIDTWKTEKYDENKKARVCPYEYLDAAQLIKHLLGLSSQNKNYKLCYLYYCVSSEQMKEHVKEIIKAQSVLLHLESLPTIAVKLDEIDKTIEELSK